MSAVQRTLTGRSAQFADTAGGGLTAAQALLMTPFFAANGILPANAILEALYDFPATDFSNIGGGSIASVPNGAKFTPAQLHSNFGWDMGSLFDKSLIIVSGIRAADFNFGAFLGKTLPAAGHPDDAYALLDESSTPAVKLYRFNGGTSETQIGSDTNFAYPAGAAQQQIGLALYCDAVAPLQQGFIRLGNGQWFRLFSTTDATYDSFRYAGIFCGNSANAVQIVAGAIGIYAE